MLYDRPYMRGGPYKRKVGGDFSVLKGILIATIIVFILQNLLSTWFHCSFLTRYGALSGDGIQQGYLWTLVTYGFLHENILHILLNLFVIFFIGRGLERILQPRKFLVLYLSSILGGGLLWIIFHFGTKDLVIGASAGALGLLLYFCLIQPDQPATFLLFFILPVTLKPKWIALAVIGMELFGFLFTELPNTTGHAISHSAHLGGMCAASIYYQLEKKKFPLFSKPSFPKKKILPPSSFKVNISNRKDLQTEVDHILDKINTDGFSSLSMEEKQILERAKDLLNR